MLTHSNTTLVSINLDEIYLLGSVMNYSNTTLVSINLADFMLKNKIVTTFKYNSCFY